MYITILDTLPQYSTIPNDSVLPNMRKTHPRLWSLE